MRFGVFGIPVHVKWTFWLMAALLSAGSLFSKMPDAPIQFAAWIIAVFVSVLFHELGHAVFQRKYGQRTEIELYHFGGLAKGEGRTLSRNQRLIMVAAGPAAGLLLALIVLTVYFILDPSGAQLFISGLINRTFLNKPMIWFATHQGFIYFLLFNLVVINVFWSIMNLLPVYPLDGGQILDATNGPSKMRQTLKIGIIAGIAASIFGFLIGQSFMAMLFLFLTLQNYQRLQGIDRPMFGGFPGGGSPGGGFGGFPGGGRRSF